MVGAIVGARAYYVAFQWDNYKDNLKEIFNLRGGGLAIYGGIIGAVSYTHLDVYKRQVLEAQQQVGRPGRYGCRRRDGICMEVPDCPDGRRMGHLRAAADVYKRQI